MKGRNKKVNLKHSQTVFVAMSGGVDSSVTAALLKKAGFNIVGVYMKQWSPKENLSDCIWKKEREIAMRAASVLDIPLLTWDFSKEYEKSVVKYMINSYKKGITPNPDVMCNKHIKFGLFLEKALKSGADFIATGHYVKKLKAKSGKRKTTEYKLLKAKDKNKDQSYFLWTLTQKQLKHCLFPIGDYTKGEVRKLAKGFGLPNWNKPDSQGVCFIGEFKMKDFLKAYIKPKLGKVIDINTNKAIGKHEGVNYYTIGQRHIFSDNSSNSNSYFVVKKDIQNNILYMDKEIKANGSVLIKDVNWISKKPAFPLKCSAKVHYGQEEQGIALKNENSGISAKFSKISNNAVVPGQSMVWYNKKQLLGGGVIT